MGKKSRLKKKRKEEKVRQKVEHSQKQGLTFMVAGLALIVALVGSYGYLAYRKRAAEEPKKIAFIKTDKGTIKLELFEEEAPITVANFSKLAKKKFFDGTKFHRVEKGLIQGGDPNSKDDDPSNDGLGGPGYTIPLEVEFDKKENLKRKHKKGTLGMAHQPMDPNSGGSQFYITLKPQKSFDGGYTIFGEVLSGLEVAKKIKKGDEIKSIRIKE